jgi:peptidyl-prolyl cis-trans isomerase D
MTTGRGSVRTGRRAIGVREATIKPAAHRFRGLSPTLAASTRRPDGTAKERVTAIMMQTIRGWVGSWVSKLLLMLLVVSFAVFGIGDVFQGTADTTAITIDEMPIDQVVVSEAFQARIAQHREQTGEVLDIPKAVELGLLDDAIEGLIQERLLDQAARDLNLRVGEGILQAELRAIPGFTDTAGNFDANAFRVALRNNNMTEAMFVARFRDQIAREYMLRSMFIGVKPPQPMVDSIYSYRLEQRVGKTITLPSSMIENVPEPSDEQLRAFHQEEAARFTAPEFRTIVIASLEPARMAAELPISDEDLQAQYEQRLDEFTVKEKRRILQVLDSDETKVRAVAKARAEGQTLSQAVQTVMGNQDTLIDFGTVEQGALPAVIDGPAFAGGAVGTRDVFQSDLGWHLLEVTAVETGSVTPFAQAKEKLRADLQKERASDRMFEIGNKLEDELAAGVPMAEAAAALDVPTTSFGPLDSTGANEAGVVVEGIPAQEQVLKSAFELTMNQASPIIETPEGNLYVVKVTQITPPALIPFETIKDRVRAVWTGRQRDEAAKALAEAALAKIRGGQTIEAAAEELKRPIVETPAITRFGNEAIQPQVDALFALGKVGDASVIAGSGGATIVQLAEIRKAETEGDMAAQARTTLNETLTTVLVNEIGGAFTESLKSRYAVEKNQTVIDSLKRAE